MKPIATLCAAGIVSAMLAACQPADDDPGPGGVSVDEARALDEAADMIEARRLPRVDEAGQSPADDGAQADDATPAPDQQQQEDAPNAE